MAKQKQQQLAKKDEANLVGFQEEGFSGIDKLPAQPPRWKVDKEKGVFYHSLTDETKRSLIINPILSKAVRALWNGEDLPKCSSQDCVTGIDRETGNKIPCAQCGNSQFGSASTGKGQACKQSFLIMAVEKGEKQPFIIAIPPTSLKLVGEYFQKLAAQKTMPREVYAELNLKETSSSGFKYQLITWDIGDKVDKERLEELNSLVEAYNATFAETLVERDEQMGKDDVKSEFGAEEVDDDIPF